MRTRRLHLSAAVVAASLASVGGSAGCANCEGDLACDDPATASLFVGTVVAVDGDVVTFELDDGSTVDVEVMGDVGELEVGAGYRVPNRPSATGGPRRAAVEEDCACEPFISELDT